MEYVNYFHFFETVKQIVNDTEIDFKVSGVHGEKFDTEYNTFVHKFINYCQKYGESTFRGKSALISSYITEVGNTCELPQNYRFEKLKSVTDEFLRKAV